MSYDIAHPASRSKPECCFPCKAIVQWSDFSAEHRGTQIAVLRWGFNRRTSASEPPFQRLRLWAGALHASPCPDVNDGSFLYCRSTKPKVTGSNPVGRALDDLANLAPIHDLKQPRRTVARGGHVTRVIPAVFLYLGDVRRDCPWTFKNA